MTPDAHYPTIEVDNIMCDHCHDHMQEHFVFELGQFLCEECLTGWTQIIDEMFTIFGWFGIGVAQ